MKRAPMALDSAKMRSFIVAGVQQVCTMACEDTGAPGRTGGGAAAAAGTHASRAARSQIAHGLTATNSEAT